MLPIFPLAFFVICYLFGNWHEAKGSLHFLKLCCFSPFVSQRVLISDSLQQTLDFRQVYLSATLAWLGYSLKMLYAVPLHLVNRKFSRTNLIANFFNLYLLPSPSLLGSVSPL